MLIDGHIATELQHYQWNKQDWMNLLQDKQQQK
jgi:hypothetical protein